MKYLRARACILFLFGILVSNSISDYRRKPKGRGSVDFTWWRTLSRIPVKNNSIPKGSGRRRAKYRDEYNPRATSLKFIALHWDNDSWIRVYTSVLSQCIYSLLALYLQLVRFRFSVGRSDWYRAGVKICIIVTFNRNVQSFTNQETYNKILTIAASALNYIFPIISKNLFNYSTRNEAIPLNSSIYQKIFAN